MNRSFKKSLMFLVVVLALMLSPLGVTTALADDQTPPPPATDEPVQPPEEPAAQGPAVPEAVVPSRSVATEEPVATKAPVAQEVTATEPPVAMEEPAATEVPVSEASTEPANLPEVLEQLPEDATIVILETSGEVLPLVTQEAANALTSGDPMWCPEGVTPGTDMEDSIQDCTAKHSSLGDLVNDLVSNNSTYSGAGTIYIASDYAAGSGSPDYGADIVFDYDALGLTDLIVQGGWDFASNQQTNSRSDLTGINSLNFYNWGDDSAPVSLTINNIFIDNAGWSGETPAGAGLYVENLSEAASSGVTLNDVSVTRSHEAGAAIYANRGNVNVRNSIFRLNYNPDGFGLQVDSGGNVTIEASQFISNVYGMEAFADGNISLSEVIADGNASYGVRLDNRNDGYGTGSITITASTFDGTHSFNMGTGLVALSDGDISLSEVIASGNFGGGASLSNGYEGSTGNIFVASSRFTENEAAGLGASSNANIEAQCSHFALNGSVGLGASLAGGTLTLKGNTFGPNYLGPLSLSGGTLVTQDYDCNPTPSAPAQSRNHKPDTSDGLPLNVIHVNGGEQNTLSCTGFSGIELVLPNGDRIILPCPTGVQASLSPVTNATLPGALDGKFAFISGLSASVDPSLTSNMIVKFIIPSDQQAADLTILHWDGTQWEELGGERDSNGFFNAYSSATGIFVMVSK